MEAPLKNLTFIATALALMALGGSAHAQRYTNYPVCAVYGGTHSSVTSCAFDNFEQCRMSVSGRGGYCELNQDYVPPRKRVRRVY
jgi:hypothetical protein